MSFRLAISRASAPLARSRAVAAPSFSALRCLSTSAVRRADDHHESHPPIIQGPGGKVGEVPTDFEQATGLERFELLGRMEGIDVWENKPLQSDRVGTLKDPIMVPSLYPSRIIGCTGSPAGSHDVLYMNLTAEKKHHRCIECGSVYSLNVLTFPKSEGGDHGSHH